MRVVMREKWRLQNAGGIIHRVEAGVIVCIHHRCRHLKAEAINWLRKLTNLILMQERTQLQHILDVTVGSQWQAAVVEHSVRRGGADEDGHSSQLVCSLQLVVVQHPAQAWQVREESQVNSLLEHEADRIDGASDELTRAPSVDCKRVSALSDAV